MFLRSSHRRTTNWFELLSSSPRGSFYSLHTQHDEEREQEPLIASSSSSSPRPSRTLHDRHRYHSSGSVRNSTHFSRSYHSQDEDSCLDIIMEKIKYSKVARFIDKFAVESEPGLTNTQLMLTNHDLKPVEPERREWGAWNFVGFWVGM
jgi:hypothetical protein